MLRKHTTLAAMCAAGAVFVAAACSVDELLKVENPEEIQVDQLNDPKLLQVQLNGVIEAVHESYASPIIQYASFLADEMITGLNWEDYARVNQRIVSYQEGPTNAIFASLSRALRMAHGLSERIRVWDPADTTKDMRAELATSLIYAGYAATLLAENMCQTVISPDPDNPSGTVLSQLETFAVAIPYFDEGLTLAQAVGRTDLVNLARTGLARAHIGQGNWAQARDNAAAVSPTFKWWIKFVDVPGGRNPLQGVSSGGNFTHGISPLWMGGHPSFTGTGLTFPGPRNTNYVVAPQTDPRIQHEPRWTTGHNGLTPLYKFFQGLRYSDYSGNTIAPPSASCPRCTGTSRTAMPLLTGFDTDILLADYVEAQHQYYEALAMLDVAANQAAILAFVNARRNVGNQPAVTLSGRALINELRNQRARDLLMGGFRLGDLRRWTRFDAGNGPFANGSYFPTGRHPNYPVWSDYENWTCFPIPRQEYEGNPNLQVPANPNVPPGI